MSENDPITAPDDAPAATVEATSEAIATPSHSPRRWPWLLALLVLGAVAALVLYAAYGLQEAGHGRVAMQAQIDASEQALQQMQTTLAQMQHEQQRLGQQQNASNATNKVLREEFLGMGERAALLEEAVARLAQSRLGGESALRLNEAEFLLAMGSARLKLHGDVAGTIAAFKLAEDALAGLDDPTLSTLRQTLVEEQAQLHELGADPRLSIRAELGVLARQLAQLPTLDDATNTARTNTEPSRLAHLLQRLVTVRRYDPDTSLLGPSQRQAALATMGLQLELAQAALSRADTEAFHAVLARLAAAMTGLFDPNDAAVQRWTSRLSQLQTTELQPDLPALDATLRELRNLRAVRQARDTAIQTSPAAAPQPATTPAPRPVARTPDPGEHAPALQVEREADPEVAP